MALPGYISDFEVSANDSDYYEVDGVKTVNWNPKLEPQDTTCYKSGSAAATAGARTRNVTLSSGTTSISGDLVNEATGLGTIIAQMGAKAKIYIIYTPSGGDSEKYLAIITALNITGDSPTNVTFSAEFQFDSLVTVL